MTVRLHFVNVAFTLNEMVSSLKSHTCSLALAVFYVGSFYCPTKAVGSNYTESISSHYNGFTPSLHIFNWTFTWKLAKIQV